MLGPVAEAERNAGKSDGDDSDEDGAADPPDHQDGDEGEPGSGETHLGIGDFAEADESGGIGDDNIRIAQADEGDEEADASGGTVFETIGNSIDDLFADVGQGEEQKED